MSLAPYKNNISPNTPLPISSMILNKKCLLAALAASSSTSLVFAPTKSAKSDELDVINNRLNALEHSVSAVKQCNDSCLNAPQDPTCDQSKK
jgi:hypothetical protein